MQCLYVVTVSVLVSVPVHLMNVEQSRGYWASDQVNRLGQWVHLCAAVIDTPSPSSFSTNKYDDQSWQVCWRYSFCHTTEGGRRVDLETVVIHAYPAKVLSHEYTIAHDGIWSLDLMHSGQA